MTKPDFSGEWALNVEASSLSPIVAPVVQRGFVRIEHREPTVSVYLSITMQGEPVEVRFQRPSNWEGDVLAFTDTVPTPDGELLALYEETFRETPPADVWPPVEEVVSVPTDRDVIGRTSTFSCRAHLE